MINVMKIYQVQCDRKILENTYFSYRPKHDYEEVMSLISRCSARGRRYYFVCKETGSKYLTVI